MKIVIASDSFKGSLSSLQVADAAREGIQAVDPACECIAVNVADGGEGLTDALVWSLKGEMITSFAADPLKRTIKTFWGKIGDMAVVETAAASGLPLLSNSERNPMKTTTYGTGQLIAEAIECGCKKFLVGLGGSATTDAGMGMLCALGWKFLDAEGQELPGCGESLQKVCSIDDSAVLPSVKNCSFTAACDVNNPFYGPRGAAYVFGPQKGADADMVAALDEGLKNFAEVIKEKYGTDISEVAGAGAAGGLGGAFLAFLGGELKPGIDMVLDTIGFDRTISGADLVITGEGRVDSQTPGGKTAAGVLKRCLAAKVPCVAVGGCVRMCPELENAPFAGIFPITDGPCTLEQAISPETARRNVARTAGQIVKLIKTFNQ